MLKRFIRFKLGTRFTLILVIVFVIGTLLSYVVLSQALQQRAQDEIMSKGLVLIGLMNSVRSYTTAHIAPLLGPTMDPQNKFIPETVPAFSAREVFENLRKTPDYANFFYKEATINPTNLRDKADDFEADLVARFQTAPATNELSGYRSVAGEDLFYSARPFIIKNEVCLGCHSVPEKAPVSMIAAYGRQNGFGWQLNDVVGTQVIYVPASKVLDAARQSLLVVMAIFIGIFALVIVLLNLLLQRSVVQPIQFMAHIAQKVTSGKMDFTPLERDQMAGVAARNDEIGQSAQVFQTMTREVQARELRLAQEVRMLRIEVDEVRKSRQVAEITETDYFQQLRQRARALRERHPT